MPRKKLTEEIIDADLLKMGPKRSKSATSVTPNALENSVTGVKNKYKHKDK